MKKSFWQSTSVKIQLWVLSGTVAVAFALMPTPPGLNDLLDVSAFMYGMLVFTTVSTLVFLAHFLMTAVLAYFYRAAPELPTAELPSCTVIVPAYNEGRHVSETLDSLLACDYPHEKLEIIAINDGSKDDTWSWIQQSAEAANGRVTPINLIQNGGKKHALYTGVLAAKGDIIITVDSDSTVDVGTLRKLVAPFADRRIGGVAGYIRAKNYQNGIFPLLMDVCFVFGCEFIRRAQSTIGSVLCTPGALSAYRKAAMLPCLDEWLDQTFMGVPSRIGEDRAITSLLLRSGYRVVYQNTAVALTCVPENYRQLCRMLIRWTRSDIRENLMLTRFVYHFNPFRSWERFALQINMTVLHAGIALACVFIPLGLISLLASGHNLPYMLLFTLVMSMLWSGVAALFYGREQPRLEMVWAFVFGVFSMFGLAWIVPYSVFTVKNSKWLTRDVPAVRRRSLWLSAPSVFGRALLFRTARRPIPAAKLR